MCGGPRFFRSLRTQRAATTGPGIPPGPWVYGVVADRGGNGRRRFYRDGRTDSRPGAILCTVLAFPCAPEIAEGTLPTAETRNRPPNPKRMANLGGRRGQAHELRARLDGLPLLDQHRLDRAADERRELVLHLHGLDDGHRLAG